MLGTSGGVEMNKSEQLIACLEGEIAKRDEELAACRVAVENCDLSRARIAELEADRDSHQRCAIQAMAELAAIKAQEPVALKTHGAWDGLDDLGELPDGTALYAAPVSEAKAQGVVMPERKTKADYGVYINEFADEAAAIYNAALDEVARLNAAPAAPAADAGASLIDWTKDAVELGCALNYAAWEFVNECPEKSALLFNNTKGPLRAAIIKYAEIVSANDKDSRP